LSDQDNLFKEKVNTNTPSAESTSEGEPIKSNAPSVADLLAGITNEDGKQKYSSPEVALQGLAESQKYIQRLEAEAKEREAETNALRETANKVTTLEETISKLAAKHPSDEASPVKSESTSSISEEAVMDLVSRALQQRELKSVAETNTNKVQTTLIAQYGEKAAEVIQEKAKQLNTTPQALGELASTSPDMVLALFNTGSTSFSPSRGSVNVPLVKPTDPPLERPTKSLLQGATSAEQTAYMQKIKEEVYRRHGVET